MDIGKIFSRRFRDRALFVLAISIILIGSGIWWKKDFDVDNGLKLLGGILALEFFLYKMITGWLFINLNLELKEERKSGADGSDHLNLTLKLVKGVSDSLWIKDIQFRVKDINRDNTFDPTEIIRPIGLKKRFPLNDDIGSSHEYWDGTEKDHYTISSGEEAMFGTYASVPSGSVLSVEVLVLGTRPFYDTLLLSKRLIQWRASLIILPCPTN